MKRRHRNQKIMHQNSNERSNAGSWSFSTFRGKNRMTRSQYPATGTGGQVLSPVCTLDGRTERGKDPALHGATDLVLQRPFVRPESWYRTRFSPFFLNIDSARALPFDVRGHPKTTSVFFSSFFFQQQRSNYYQPSWFFYLTAGGWTKAILQCLSSKRIFAMYFYRDRKKHHTWEKKKKNCISQRYWEKYSR